MRRLTLSILILLFTVHAASADSDSQLREEYSTFVNAANQVKSGVLSVEQFTEQYGDENDLGPAINAIFEEWQKSFRDPERKKKHPAGFEGNFFTEQVIYPGLSSGVSQDAYYRDMRVAIRSDGGLSPQDEAVLFQQVDLLKEFHTHLLNAEGNPGYTLSHKGVIGAEKYQRALRLLQKYRRLNLESLADAHHFSDYDIGRYQLERKYGVEVQGVISDSFVANYVKARRYRTGPYPENTILAQLANDMGKVSLGGLFIMGALYVSPESVSGWSDSQKDFGDLNDLARKHNENVEPRAVMDEDDLWLNYFAHPVSGGWYYMFARKTRGLNPFQSFVFAGVLSTLWWEYGIEAFAEVPSAQDLVITPVIGALFGEVFYQLDGYIDRNGGRFIGSEILGSIVQFLINPMEALVVQLDNLGSILHVYLGGEIIWEQQRNLDYDEMESIIGFRIVFRPFSP